MRVTSNTGKAYELLLQNRFTKEELYEAVTGRPMSNEPIQRLKDQQSIQGWFGTIKRFLDRTDLALHAVWTAGVIGERVKTYAIDSRWVENIDKRGDHGRASIEALISDMITRDKNMLQLLHAAKADSSLPSKLVEEVEDLEASCKMRVRQSKRIKRILAEV